MKLLARTAANLFSIIIAVTVLSASLSVITEHMHGDSGAAAAVRYEHETVGNATVSVFGHSVDLAPLKRLSDGAVRLIDRGTAMLPDPLANAADSLLDAVGAASEAVTRGILSFRTHQP